MSNSDLATAGNSPVVYVNRLTLKNKIGRLLWAVVYAFLFRPSPQFCYGWRRFLIRSFGGTIAKNAVIHPSVKIWAPWNLVMDEHSCLAFGVDCYCVDRISIGKRATVSQYAFLCTASHELSVPTTPLITAPIEIKDNAWVFARAFVGPGVTMGEGSVAGACAVVVKSVEPWTIVAGNPAKPIKQRARF